MLDGWAIPFRILLPKLCAAEATMTLTLEQLVCAVCDICGLYMDVDAKCGQRTHISLLYLLYINVLHECMFDCVIHGETVAAFLCRTKETTFCSSGRGSLHVEYADITQCRRMCNNFSLNI